MSQKIIPVLLVVCLAAVTACTPRPAAPRLPLAWLTGPAEPLVAEQQYTAAVELLEQAAQTYPESATPLVRIGQIYLAQRRWLLAEDAFNRGLAREPRRAEVMAGLAESLLQQGRLVGAQYWWQQTIAARPQFPGAYTGLGRAYLEQLDFEQARQAFEAQQSRRFDPEAEWYLAALAAPVNVAAATGHLNRLADGPNPTEALLARRDYLLNTLAPFANGASQADAARTAGIALAQIEAWPLAVYALSIARDRSQTIDAETLAFLGHALAQMGRPAFDIFEAARQADPTSALPYYFEGLYFRQQDALAAAEAMFVDALALDAQNLAIYIELARTKDLQGQLAAAEAWYLAAVETAGKEDVRWVQRLRLQFYTERGYRPVEAGIPLAQLLLEEDGRDAEVYGWLGWMQFVAGQPEAGEDSLRRALELEPDLVSARYYLARLLHSQKRYEQARQAYRRVIDLDLSGRFRDQALRDLQRLETDSNSG